MIVVLLVPATPQIGDNASLRGGLSAPNDERPPTSRSQPRERGGLPAPSWWIATSLSPPRRGSRRRDSIVRGEARGLMIQHHQSDPDAIGGSLCALQALQQTRGSNGMSSKKNQAPSTHGPGVITEGAQPITLDSSVEPSTENQGRPDLQGQVRGKFSAELWREQVLEDESLASRQKLLLILMSVKFDYEGKGSFDKDFLTKKMEMTERTFIENLKHLEQKGWYKKSRHKHIIECVALKGRI